MNKVTEDYCDFETAKLLKEKGFDERCDYEYGFPAGIEQGVVLQKWRISHDGRVQNSELIDDACAAPTLQMAMKWLREKHHIVIDVCLEDYITEVDGSLTITYTYTIWYFNRHLSHTGKTDIRYTDATVDGEEKNSYEEACEAAIKYCLENLI